MADYSLVGKNVLIHLYNKLGQIVGTITGRVADVAEKVPVGENPDGTKMLKDLAYVVNISTGDPEVPYKNSAGEENESWFAIQDMEVLEDDQPRLFTN